MPSAKVQYPYDAVAAVAHLRQCDAKLAHMIDQVGEFKLEFEPKQTPFEALLQSIVYQQLSGRAAATIHGRLLANYPDQSSPRASDILNTPDAALRGCGLSAAKVQAVKDLADKTCKNELPGSKQITKMGNQEIVEAFSAVRGIGPWTAEMLLIFNLGRGDVLPSTDLGIRRGFMITYGLEEMPKPAEVVEAGKKWSPYRSVASWYLWRAADGDSKPRSRT